nr:hypothetical protein [Tanacetum cinerariifolium]
MRRVGKGCLGVETPLFEGMIAARELENQGRMTEESDKDEGAKVVNEEEETEE